MGFLNAVKSFFVGRPPEDLEEFHQKRIDELKEKEERRERERYGPDYYGRRASLTRSQEVERQRRMTATDTSTNYSRRSSDEDIHSFYSPYNPASPYYYGNSYPHSYDSGPSHSSGSSHHSSSSPCDSGSSYSSSSSSYDSGSSSSSSCDSGGGSSPSGE